jgi:hypothetical protein
MFTQEQLEQVRQIYPDAMMVFQDVDYARIKYKECTGYEEHKFIELHKPNCEFSLVNEGMYSELISNVCSSKDFTKILNVLKALSECEEG